MKCKVWARELDGIKFSVLNVLGYQGKNRESSPDCPSPRQPQPWAGHAFETSSSDSHERSHGIEQYTNISPNALWGQQGAKPQSHPCSVLDRSTGICYTQVGQDPSAELAAPHKHLVRFSLICRTSCTEGSTPLPATHLNLWFMLLPLVDDSSQKQVT